MSHILNKIKAAQLQYRKERKADYAAALTTLIGEVEMVGKNEGREVTDSDVISKLKKFTEGAREVAAHAEAAGLTEREHVALTEVVLYGQFLPVQLSEQSIRETILGIKETNPSVKLPDIMKHFKALYEGQYDGKLVSSLAKELL